ncbi:MAG TPA: hypothetical protein VFW33_16045 [Gemmataceae bacterium]|nr:hypothetical protein [Gemmataceae bacterium]
MRSGSRSRFVLAVFSLLAAGAALRAGDPPATGEKNVLDEARRREAVAQQKAEDDFRTALVEMNKLENSNPTRAADRLKKMLGVLEEDTVLPAAKREAWKRVVKDRIRVCEAQADRKGKDDADRAGRDVKRDERRQADEQKERDEAVKKRDFKEAERLMKDGRYDEARKLTEKYPDSPGATANRYMSGIASARQSNEALKREKEGRMLGAFSDVEKSAMPPIGEIEFPSPEKWREITRKRTKSLATDMEKKILKALDSPVTIMFEGSTFESAIDYLQTLSGVTIIVDKVTLERAGINYDTPVNVRKMRTSLRTALRKVLGEYGLTYIVEKETIHVVTPDEAKTRMSVRTYYLGDMAAADPAFALNPILSRLDMQRKVAELLKMITDTVEPDSWQVNNPEAKGTIVWDPVHLSIIVKQSAEIHYMLGGLGR